MLYLAEDDLLAAVNLAELMDAIEDAYRIYTQKTYEMPPRMHVDYKQNTLLYMPCFLESSFGTKILTLFPGNTTKNKPVIQGFVLLHDPETGAPLALLNGAKLTAIRTGAVGGTAIRHLTPPQVKRVGLIGAGVQGFHQLLFAATARQIETISVYDQNQDRLPSFRDKLRQALPGIRIEAVADATALLDASEVVITATPATAPVLPDDSKLLQGRHFIAIGSYKPTMREYPEAVYRLVDKVYIDTEHGLEESGDLITPLEQGWIKREQIETFGNFLAQKTVPSTDTTLFKSVGMALFDIVVAELICRRAEQKGIGQKLRL